MRNRRACLRTLGLTLGTALLMLVCMEAFSRASLQEALSWMAGAPGLAMLNLLLPLGLSALCVLLPLRGRRIARVVLLFLCAALGITNHYKLIYRMEPLLFSDVTQMGDAAQALTGLHFEVDVWQMVWVALFFVIALVLCIRLGKRGVRGTWKTRLAAVVISLACVGVALWAPVRIVTNTGLAEVSRSHGTLYTAFLMESERRALLMLNYDEQEVRTAAQKLASEAQGGDTGARPNVIVVLSESFTDDDGLRRLGVELTEPITPHFDELSQSCLSGLLTVPKMGGGTSETEFEVLTGLMSRYAINPYSMGLPPMQSLASFLREKGYRATAIHWYAGVYYDRYRNLRMEGFDAFYTTDTTTATFERVGQFVSDREHYRAILSQLGETDERDFVFCLTMQNHGGYAYDVLTDERPFANALSEESAMTLGNYCMLLEESDNALRDFITELQNLSEPTMLVFFGDHIPPLGKALFDELGSDLEGAHAKQTPYFIWRNDAALSGTQDMASYQLGSCALTLAGLNDDPMFTLVERMRTSGEASEADQSLYDLLCYDALFGEQYAYDECGVSPENEGFLIGGEMKAEGYLCYDLGSKIYLYPKLTVPFQAYALRIDQKNLPYDYLKLETTEFPITLQCVLENSRGVRYNQSEELRFETKADLLTYCEAMTVATLSPESWGLTAVDGRKGVFRTKPFAATLHAVTLNGEPSNWQPTYGVQKANEYGVDKQGRVYIAVPEAETAEEAVALLQQQNALLHIGG